MTIGKRHTIEVGSVEEASRLYCEYRDSTGEGASTFPDGKVNGHTISYNGKVWKGKPMVGELVFNPYAKQVAA